MGLFVITFAVFALMLSAMSMGVIIANRRIKGSCGGLASIIGLERTCDICEHRSKCTQSKQAR